MSEPPAPPLPARPPARPMSQPATKPLPQRRRAPAAADRFVPAPPPADDEDDHMREITAIMDYFRRDEPGPPPG
jgi:hypothetical protein